jgi:hypothetical protein
MTVSFARHVACKPCLGHGCGECELVGWIVEETTAKVTVPHGATPGTRLTLEGAADVIDGVARPLVVEIVEPGPRAEELRATERDFEAKLETTWQMDRAPRVRRRRRLGIGVAVVLALLGVVQLKRFLAKPTTGEACVKNDDCRSGQCVRLIMLYDGEYIWDRTQGTMCTATCATDLDCPSPMLCRPMSKSKNHTVCVPRGVVPMPTGE